MNRIISMSKLIKMLLGIPSDMPKERTFEITPKMVNSSVVRMDLKSFRKSKVVQEQVCAASSVN